MTVYFDSLVHWDEVDAAPPWLVWPAFVVMLVGVGGQLVASLVRRNRR